MAAYRLRQGIFLEQKTTKPRLFIDIDGVIYGHYGDQWQIRPYVVTLTRWAKEYFDIFWVSFNSHKKEVVETTYAGGNVILHYFDYTTDEKGFKQVVPPTWHPKALQSEKLVAIQKYGGLDDEWLMIEDTPPTDIQREILKEKNMLHRWIVVPDTGADVLLDLKYVLENYVKTKKLEVPFEWATRISEERSMALTAEWKGYGESTPERWSDTIKKLSDTIKEQKD